MRKLWIGVIAGGLVGLAATGLRGDEDLLTSVYVVPPTFLKIGGQPPGGAAVDPFAPPDEAELDRVKPNAKWVLETVGITFGRGASAVYNPATSQLIVRNTQGQMELVEAFVDSIKSGVEKQMRLEIRIATLDDIPATDEVFDLLKPEAPICAGAPPNFEYPDNFLSNLYEKSGPVPSPQRELIWNFTEEQTAAIFDSLNKRKGASLSDPVERLCLSGQWIVVEDGERKIGVSTVLGADAFTVDVHVFLPRSAKPFEADIVDGYQIPDVFSETVPDGRTVTIAERGPGEKFDVLFITAEIVDGHGNRVRNSIARSHVVEKGETLDEIAGIYGFDASEILELNRSSKEEVAVGEILLVPPAAKPDRATERALKNIFLPKIDFSDTAFGEALGFLKDESLRVTEGSDLVVPRIVLRGVDDLADEPLTLRLQNVPLVEALRYTTSLMNCKHEIEGNRVVIVPLE